MTSTNSGMTPRMMIEAELSARSYKDKDFRHELLTNPRATLQRYYAEWFPNHTVPEEITFKVLEEDAHTQYFVLSAPWDENLTEVDEESLERVVHGGASIGALERGLKSWSSGPGPIRPTPTTVNQSNCWACDERSRRYCN